MQITVCVDIVVSVHVLPFTSKKHTDADECPLSP